MPCFDRGTRNPGSLAAVLAVVALTAGAAGCGRDNAPQPADAPATSTAPVAAPSSSPSAPQTSTSSSETTSAEGSESSDTTESDSSETTSASSSPTPTGESASEEPTGSSQPAELTCAKFNSFGVGSQRDTLARIARANPGSPLEKHPNAYLNDARATCSQPGQESTLLLDVLSLDGTKYKAQ